MVFEKGKSCRFVYFCGNDNRNKMKTIFEHRSIRKFSNRKVEESVIERLAEAAGRASTVGNMQLYSFVLTSDEQMLKKLSPLHFGQVERMNAPLVATVCCDVHRFSRWCEASGATPSYENPLWFVNSAIDASLAAQNMILEAEHLGLGICILGTTLYTAEQISELLELPKGVIPLTTIVIGYPDENPPLVERLPSTSFIHRERYEDYSDEKVREIWSEKESMDYVKRLVEENGTRNLAEVFTLKRYNAEDNATYSAKYLAALEKQGFFKSSNIG